MKKPRALPVFTEAQRQLVQQGLAMKVAGMMGRKLEEGDWTEVYCRAKGIPNRGWSNLHMDVMHEGLGVEHKMSCVRSKEDIRTVCGTSRMHPAETRSIRVDSRQGANAAMRSVFKQYAALIESRRQALFDEGVPRRKLELRKGWLLWRASLHQFLYFEEPMLAPDPKKYCAEWVTSGTGKGRRKTSRNLWIYEKDSDRKRFSVTSDAGAKIQPYFDIPSPSDPHVYVFTVIGEYLDTGQVRVWLTEETAQAIKVRLGSFDPAAVNRWLMGCVLPDAGQDKAKRHYAPGVVPLLLDPAAYQRAAGLVQAVNDDHLFRSLLHFTAP